MGEAGGAIGIIDRDGIIRIRYRKVEPLPFTRRRSAELLAIVDQDCRCRYGVLA